MTETSNIADDGPQDCSEYRKADFIIKVYGFGKPSEYKMYYRTHDLSEKYSGWSNWNEISSMQFQYIDKQARLEIGSDKDVSSLYAKYMMDLIS